MDQFESTMEYSDAINQHSIRCRMAQQNRKKMLEEFKDSKCDLFCSADFYYYESETGVPVDELIRMATFAEPMANVLENAKDFGDMDLINLLIPML
jgi:hypothetical protein